MNLVDTIVESFNRAVADLVAAIPTIIGALFILLVGWIVGRIVGGIVTAALARTGADGQIQRHAGTVYGAAAEDTPPSQFFGLLVKWLIYILFFIAAANFLGWTQVSSFLNEFLAWLPSLVIAVVIIVAGPIIGRILRRTIEASSMGMGLGDPKLLGRVAEIGVIAAAVIIALYQVGIASDLIFVLFVGVVAALALALGLAFGLGGREVAGEVARDWYERSKGIDLAAAIDTSPTPPPPPPASPMIEPPPADEAAPSM
jgi:hypothetical protein